MALLMMHREVLKRYYKLPTKVQKKVAEFIDRFQNDPADPSLHVHKLEQTMADPKVRGANLPDGYRAVIIAPEKGDTYLMVHIDAHDKAYTWAKNKRFEMHPVTGVFQVFDVQEIQSAVQEQSQPDMEAPYPLSRLEEKELLKAGVPEPLIPAVQAISSDEALEALSDYLPKDCRDVLLGIAAGMSLEESLVEMLGIEGDTAPELVPDGPGDFTHVDKKANFDLVLINGEEHLKDILQASLEEWRIFLHPYQKKLVQWKTNGPMNINGSAGTGKTVVLMHRAVHLANHLENSKDRVMVTTFTTNLSITLEEYIRKLDEKAAKKIEVTNLHALARTICMRSGWKGRIATEEDCRPIWDELMATWSGELPMSREELSREYWEVIDANGIEREEAYLTTVRSGRSRISRKQRRAAWPVFRAFQRELKRANLMTFEGAIHQARLAAEQGNFQKFRHVLVDEVQDFSLEALKLIRAISPVKENLSDPLCMVGDGHQRIYRTKIPMSRAKIEIRGRSRRLKVNYRTSEQIRQYAQAMLEGLEIDDLDGGTVSIKGDHSAFKGPEPMVEACDTESAEAQAVVAWVRLLMDGHGLKPHEICVTPCKSEIITALEEDKIPTVHLKPRELDPGSDMPGVRLGDIKRIKGLEFRAIALACANREDPMNHLKEAEQLARCERYVAATRAREHLLVTIAKIRLQNNQVSS